MSEKYNLEYKEECKHDWKNSGYRLKENASEVEEKGIIPDIIELYGKKYKLID